MLNIKFIEEKLRRKNGSPEYSGYKRRKKIQNEE
jgi:hypothetical protein